MGNIEFGFAAPDDTLTSLSFCRPTGSGVADWVAELPMANTAECARLLHVAVQEISQWRTTPTMRLAALEALRTTVHYICARLDRHAHERSGPDIDPAALSAQRLQLDLVAGYKAAVRDSLRGRNDAAGRSLLAKAVHRALADMARVLVRACHDYTPAAEGTWREMHQLYLLSEELALTDQIVEDDENHLAQLTIEETYLRALMLAVARPNQLREHQLTAIFNALELWVHWLSISEPNQHTLFVVDLASDRPPSYRALGYAPSQFQRGIRTDRLMLELEAWLNELKTDVPVPEYLDPLLVSRLVHNWGVVKQRSFRRCGATGTFKVCAGLRAAHWHISGGVTFAWQLGDAAALLQPEINPFNNAASATADPSPPPSMQVFDADIEDTSPTGYCMRWRPHGGQRVLAGELLALREVDDRRWRVAICRWIEHLDGPSRMGVELLSPRAIPVAVRRIEKRGGPLEFSRALLLPALEILHQPATLIMPRDGFGELQKVQVQRQGVRTTAQLLRRIQITESVIQFTFRMLDGYLENLPADLTMDDLRDSMGTENTRASR